MKAASVGSRNIALVVDDNPESLGMVSQALERHGMTVLIARDGRAAIDVTHRVQPDVILMDAIMPEMDGFETCRILKFGPNPVLAPIIFMTGLSDQEHIVKGLGAGGVDYITKPVVLDELIARVSTHVQNSKLIQSARDALDSVGRSVLAFNASGEVLWGTQNALDLVDPHLGDMKIEALKLWLATVGQNALSTAKPFTFGAVALTPLGRAGADEHLVKVTVGDLPDKRAVIQERFGLTPREAEVLYWLTLGKTNKDMSIILDLSARTVNKHLEQIFKKMGVDNRTSAAVAANQSLFNNDTLA